MPLNATQAAMLGLLHDGPMTGGEINVLAQKWLAPYWTVTRSQVYRELPTMEAQGYISSGKAGSRNSVPFRITAVGKRTFQTWLRSAPANDLLRNEAVLRVAFGQLHRGNDLADMLEKIRNVHEQAVAEIADLVHEATSEGMEYDTQALRFAIMYHQMIIGWLETVELP